MPHQAEWLGRCIACLTCCSDCRSVVCHRTEGYLRSAATPVGEDLTSRIVCRHSAYRGSLGPTRITCNLHDIPSLLNDWSDRVGLFRVCEIVELWCNSSEVVSHSRIPVISCPAALILRAAKSRISSSSTGSLSS